MRLRQLLQSMAVLDAILEPNWEYRYYCFDAHWSQGQMMGSVRNGSGDELFAVFDGHGAFLKGCAHESSAASVPSAHFYRDLPAEFEGSSCEPAFSPDSVTFCIWFPVNQSKWSSSAATLPDGIDDGSADLLSMLDGNPETYWRWAREYYDRDIPMHAVESVYQQRLLTEELVTALNPQQGMEHLRSEIAKIGYAI